MLGNLLKYELKSTARTFIPLYIAIILVSIVNGFSLNSEMFKMQGIATMLLGALFIALFVVTIVVIIQRFKKNLLEDEGYLMFTLPVSPKMLVLSKYIVSLIWVALSTLVAILSFNFIFIVIGEMSFSDVYNVLIELINEYEIWSMILSILILIICAYSIFIFNIYLSLSLGQLPIFNKHRTIASFVSFIVMSTIISNFQGYLNSLYIEPKIESVAIGQGGTIAFPTNILFFNVVISLAIVICLFAAINYILKNKLNLE